jgi:DnaJ-class molecular chaperone
MGTRGRQGRTARHPGANDPKPGNLLLSGLSLLAKAGKKAGEFLFKKTTGVEQMPVNRLERKTSGRRGSSLTYQIEISQGQARHGAVVQIALPHLENGKTFSVHIPAGVRSGTKLRLREMGMTSPENPLRRGDVFLEVHVA